jgi:hypothetical protein
MYYDYDNIVDLSREQEIYLDKAEECGLHIVSVDPEKVIFDGSPEAFLALEALELDNPFYEYEAPEEYLND